MTKSISIVLLLSLLTACTGVLDLHPQDELTPESYWKSASSLELYINQFYTSFGTHLSYYSMDNNSDNEVPTSPNAILDGIGSVPSTGGGWSWDDIRDVNIFLKNAHKATEGDQSTIKQYIGEGHFFRAFFYFQKLKQFGAVPIYQEPLNTDSKGLMASRVSRDKVADFIISDLDSAISLLKEKSQLPTNRLNKAAAIQFKSRVCLYEGSWEEYHEGTPFGVKGSDGAKYLKMAEQAAYALMSSGKFSLYSTGHPDVDYYNAFNRTDLSNVKEAILSVHRGPEFGLGNVQWNYLNGARSQGTGMSKQLVESYLAKDGKPITISTLYRGDTTLKQVVENRDPRLAQSLWVPGDVRIDYNDKPDLIFEHPRLAGGDATTTGYMIRKGSNTDPIRNSGASGQDQDNTDGYIFRYAEVLLNYAESKAELANRGDTTFTQHDLDISINLLRDRVGMPHLTMNVPVDPTMTEKFSGVQGTLKNVILEIRRERRVELALEGFRFDDLMRWAAGDLINGLKLKGARLIKGISFPDLNGQLGGIRLDGDNYIWYYKNSIPNGFGFNESRDYLLPIPSEELVLNSNLKQNPGWE